MDGELLGVVTSASVAGGYHAGDPLTMVETARMAAARGVSVGAHPSYADREGFGRRPLPVPPDELLAEIMEQVRAMESAAAAAGTRLRFVKPHGALYNRAAADADVARTVVRAAADVGLPLLCPSGSEMHRVALAAGVACYAEAFADRAYRSDGTLAARDAGGVIDDPAEVARRAVDLALHRKAVAIDGSVIRVEADSLCIHGDTPGAVTLARSVRQALEDAGIALRPFATG